MLREKSNQSSGAAADSADFRLHIIQSLKPQRKLTTKVIVLGGGDHYFAEIFLSEKI
jgi:hypothetical protein